MSCPVVIVFGAPSAIFISAMGEVDMVFRHLLRTSPVPFLRLAFPRRRLESLGSLDPSVDRPRQRTADNLFRVRDEQREVAVHVEIERFWRPDLPPRLFEYASSAAAATELPVWTVMLLLQPGGVPPAEAGIYRIRGVDGDAFVFRYHVLPLWRLDAREMLVQLGLEAAPLCIAMQGANEEFILDVIRDVITDRKLAERDRRTITRLLYYMSAAILGTETVRRIFHMMEWLMEDPNVRELIAEWEDKGHAKGRVEEARTGLHRVLELRSLAVTPDVRARIEAESDATRLRAWHDAAVTAGSIGDVFQDG